MAKSPQLKWINNNLAIISPNEYAKFIEKNELLKEMMNIFSQRNRKKSVVRHFRITTQQEEDFKTIIFRPITVGVNEVDPTSTPQVPQEYRRSTAGVQNLLKVLNITEMSRKELQQSLGLKHEGNFRENYLEPAIELGLIEMKYPDSPNHPRQKYLVTKKGKELLDNLENDK